MKKLKFLIIAFVFMLSSCDFVDKVAINYLEIQGYEICVDDDIDPGDQDIPLAEQILVCGGAEELTATQSGNPSDEQIPAYNCQGDPINWWRWKKDSPLPGSGSVKVYDVTGTDYTNSIGYFTPDFQEGVLEGYRSIVTQINVISVEADSAHYVHPQIDSPNDCLNGPNSTSTGASSTTSIECINWPKLDGTNVEVGDTIYFVVETN